MSDAPRRGFRWMFWELVDFLAFALFGPLRCPRCGLVLSGPLGQALRSCPRCQPWRFTYAGDELRGVIGHWHDDGKVNDE